ncbi:MULTISPECIES: GldG family protein [unclassified Ruminococcus]|uniref:GldG family protein n=1 Tax=unclassified Ruminococcus TaxID=2608920 RepID=UPI00210F1E53|nr:MULTISPECIES: GldG family protein [unclassified Ruminococcus]MCQ4021445.1 hypothetical protein [Ruminococcus sp. zg-924]MCQ4113890.1 hypothetical protein [Ruminococcus sp. zg-921]
MNYKDEKENLNENTSAVENEESKISEEAASALEAGTFDEKVIEENTDDNEASSDTKKPKKPKKKNPFSSRKFKKGGFAIILTCLVIVGVIVINIIVNVLQAKVPMMSIDMSGQNLYELSDSSKELARSVDKDVTITVLGKEDAYTQADENFLKANALLKKYPVENDKISIEYLDLQSNPTFVNKYPNEHLSSFSYIVSCGDRYKYLDVASDLFTLGTDATTGSTYVQSSNVESAVTSAIYYVTSDDQTKVTVLGGFSASSQGNLSGFTALLKSNNYDVSEINLLTEDIPQDSNMAILYQPISDLTDEAAKRITDFLSNDGKYGKNLFYVPTYTKLDAPNIDSILEEWGLSLGQGVVAETDSAYMPFRGEYYYSIFDYSGNEYTNDIKNTNKYLMGAYTRPVIINDGAKATAIATTSQSAALRSFDAADDWDPTQHIEGSFNAGAVSVRTGDEAKSTVTVWGSEMSFYSPLLNSSTYVNGEYFVNLFNKLTNRQDTGFVIEGKNTQSAQLGIMSDQILVLGSLFMYLIPAIVIVLGLVIWIRRRHR